MRAPRAILLAAAAALCLCLGACSAAGCGSAALSTTGASPDAVNEEEVANMNGTETGYDVGLVPNEFYWGRWLEDQHKRHEAASPHHDPDTDTRIVPGH